MMIVYYSIFAFGFIFGFMIASIINISRLAQDQAQHERLYRELNRKPRFIDADTELNHGDNVSIAKFNKKG